MSIRLILLLSVLVVTAAGLLLMVGLARAAGRSRPAPDFRQARTAWLASGFTQADVERLTLDAALIALSNPDHEAGRSQALLHLEAGAHELAAERP